MKTRNILIITQLCCMLCACANKQDIALINTENLCKDWRDIYISKKDVLTEETASQIEGNNKARPAWGCQYGQDRAKG